MALDINRDADKIQQTINRIARRAQYYAKKGAIAETEEDFTYSRTIFVDEKTLRPRSLNSLIEQYGVRRIKQELEFLEELSQRNYIGSVRSNFKEAVLMMAEQMYGEDSKEYKAIERLSPIKITRMYKMGTLDVYNSYKTNKASAMVALLEKATK